MAKNVTVYSSDTCIYCHEAKKYLDSLGVSYTEKNISKDMAARKELIAQGFMGVPVIVVDGETIQGFDKARLDMLLK
ncbi:MAG TPA: glutaredoxin family protein [Clostridiales bacterium]|nr:glutaredoxin family protein [Clostridiales bacterium]